MCKSYMAAAAKKKKPVCLFSAHTFLFVNIHTHAHTNAFLFFFKTKGKKKKGSRYSTQFTAILGTKRGSRFFSSSLSLSLFIYPACFNILEHVHTHIYLHNTYTQRGRIECSWRELSPSCYFSSHERACRELYAVRPSSPSTRALMRGQAEVEITERS